MQTSPTDAARLAFLQQVQAWRPDEHDAAQSAIDRLIRWSERLRTLMPLPSDEQKTVAFGLTPDRVIWRAYPGKTVPAKVVVLPGLRTALAPAVRMVLIDALTSAVQGVEVAEDGHLQCPIVPLAQQSVFDRFSEFLVAALAAAEAFDAPAS